jgi:hypothetical protein
MQRGRCATQAMPAFRERKKGALALKNVGNSARHAGCSVDLHG